MINTIHNKEFYHDGRGPELIRVVYNEQGTSIVSIEYYNPDTGHTPENVRKLVFTDPQAFMITPEEEYNYEEDIIQLLKKDKGAIIDMGKSNWYRSFTNRHSKDCSHYKIVLYNEIVDIICKQIDIGY